MHDEAISPEQRAALSSLKPAAERGFYLAGGTGLCLRLAHRRSIDLDLFREQEFDPEQLLRDLAAEGLVATNAKSKPSTLWIDVGGVRTSLMSFPYPSVAPPDMGLAVPVASIEDIAAMKIEAIASRGARKDFYDLYFIGQSGLDLPSAFAAFRAKFQGARPDVMYRLKALAYFEDAEREPDPLLLRPVAWQQVREYFEAAVQAMWSRI